MRLWCLNKPDGVSVRVFHRCDQLTPTDVCDILLYLCVGVQKYLQAFLNVVNVPVSDRTCHSLVVAAGIQADSLVPNAKANIIRLIRVRLYTQKLAVQRLCTASAGPSFVPTTFVTTMFVTTMTECDEQM